MTLFVARDKRDRYSGIAVDFEVQRATVADLLAGKSGAHAAGELNAVDAAKVKLLSSEVQGRVIDVCVQLHGGYGYMEEYFVGRAYQDARVTRIWAGSNEIMKELIGRSMGFGDPRRG